MTSIISVTHIIGIASVLKTDVREDMGVRLPPLPLKKV